MEVRIKETNLRNFCEKICLKLGLSKEDTFNFIDSLIFANLRGIDSHGIMRLPSYIRRLTEGGCKINPQIQIVKEEPSMVLLDGDSGLGQVVSMYAVKAAINKAKKNAVSIVGVNNSSHFGAASYYSIKMAEADMIGISMTNGEPVMAAWGGEKSIIGNHPISIAAPHLKRKPVVLDIATSKVSGGKVRLAAKNKQKIPKDWIIDGDGKKTDDPNKLSMGGALLPFGEYKGYGLAVMIEILTSILMNAGILYNAKSGMKVFDAPTNIGHCFIAINIKSFIPLGDFKEKVDWMVNEIKNSPLAEGVKEILVPGEIEYKVEQKRKVEGIPISEQVLEDMQKLSEDFREPLYVNTTE